MSDNDNAADFWNGATIYRYTRAQAIADGVLIDISATAREAGFRWPVAITAAAWSDSVAWTAGDSARQTPQDEAGRLWDVLWMAACELRRARPNADRAAFPFYRVPRDGSATAAELTTLDIHIGPGDDAAPVFTIMLPGED